MIVKITTWGIGSPGKLWTSATPEAGQVLDARIVERTCGCGAKTRKLRVKALENASSIDETCEVPALFLTAGGVGSIATSTDLAELQLCNWSGRVGGHAIVSPVATVSGYWNESDLPLPKAGYEWHRTYSGSTLSEFVLLRTGGKGGGGLETDKVSVDHVLPVVGLRGVCPKCREKAESEAIPEDLTVSRETLTGVVDEGYLSYYERELGLEKGAVAFSARRLHHLAWESRNDALKAAIETAKQTATTTPATV